MITGGVIKRTFMYAGAKLADIDINLTPDQVRQQYAASLYPELNNAVVGGSTFNDTEEIITFERSVGVKG